MTGADAGLKAQSVTLPTGQTIGPGYMVEDHGRRPLPSAVVEVQRNFRKQGVLSKVVDSSE
eukprot:11528248-Alexandrium_andersonii.AAC.1